MAIYKSGVFQPFGRIYWKDMLNAGSSLGTGTAAPVRTRLGASNVYYNALGIGDGFATEIQFNHDAVQASIMISPHIHLILPTAPVSGDKVKLSFDYTFSSINGNFSASPTADPKEITFTSEAQYQHLLMEFSDVTVTMGLSSILMCGISRVAKSAGGTEYGSNIGIIGFDVHYQIDTPGSQLEYTK